MRSVLKTIQKKGRNLFILNLILFSLILCFTFISVREDKTVSDMFKGVCEVHNLQELNDCYQNNNYVRIHFEDVYSTDYGYYVDDVLKAYYVDLDLEGYSLIAVVKKDVGEELFSDNNNITYIDGIITDFDEQEGHDGVIEAIKKDYLESFGEDWTEEDINNLVLPIQIDAYENPKIANIIFLSVIAIFGIITLIFIIKGLCMMIKPKKYKAYSKVDDKDSLENEFENKVIYENSNVCLTPNYIIHLSFGKVKIKKVDSLVWVYQKITKQYGVAVNKCYILNFKDGDNFSISLKDEQILNQFGSDILVGYTNENLKEYRKIVEQSKKEIQ